MAVASTWALPDAARVNAAVSNVNHAPPFAVTAAASMGMTPPPLLDMVID